MASSEVLMNQGPSPGRISFSVIGGLNSLTTQIETKIALEAGIARLSLRS